MRGLWFLVLVTSGCETIFPLDLPLTPRPRGCSPMSMLVDSFDGSGPVSKPWEVAETQTNAIAESGGTLLMDGVAQTTYAASSGPFFELRDQHFSVTGSLSSGALSKGSFRVELVTQEANENRLVMGVMGVEDTPGNATPRLYYGHIDHLADGTPVPVLFTDLAYDPTAHARWQIEQVGDTTRWLAAPLDGAFEPVFETQGLDWVTFMRPILLTTPEANPIVTRFDDVDGGATATGAACPAGSLRETFDEPPSIDWRQFGEDCEITFEEGELRARFGGATINHNCAIQTATVYDLTQRSVTLDVLEISRAQSSGAVVFEVEALDGSTAVFIGDGATVKVLASGEPRGAVDGVPRFWRFRVASGDDLVFEVSDDGELFEPIGNTGVGTSGLDAVRIAVAFAGDGIGTDAIARFGALTSP